MAKDLYEILGIGKDATDQEIKRAYRRKARELHPDVSTQENAEEKFKELNEAYDVLSDPNKKAQYDRFGTIPGAASGPGGNPFGGGYVDFEDIFGGGGGFGVADIFSSFFNSEEAGPGSRTEGRNMNVGLRLTLQEAAKGVKKEIIYDRLSPCEDCHGTGLGKDGQKQDCVKCHGQGKVVSVQQTILGSMQTTSVCPDCKGSGKTIKNPCTECNGQGRVPDRQRISVDVPAGVRMGQQIRINGYGEAGMYGDKSGDLIVTCKIMPHDYFDRDGDNLLARLDISFIQAITGDNIEIDGIFEGEKVKLKIPKASQNGDVICAKNCGMPKLNSSKRGNLYAQLHITIPKRLNKNQKDLCRNLYSDMKENSKKPLSSLQRINN